jgi:hypothetical protein
MKSIDVGKAERMSDVLDVGITMADFFKVSSLVAVDHLNMSVWVYAGRPEWLRGISKERDMPRRVTGDDLEFKFVVPPTVGERTICIDWVVENLNYGWNINNRFISFDNAEDAIFYKFKWG